MRTWRGLVARWWVIYGGVLAAMILTAIVIQLLLPPPNYQDAAINYQRFRSLGMIAEYVEPLLVIPAVVFLIAVLLYPAKNRNSWRVTRLVGMTVVVYVLWLAVLGPLVGMKFGTSISPSPRMVHIDAVTVSERQYNLSSYDLENYPGTVGGYVIYECDLAGIQCRNIHIEPIYALAYRTLEPELRTDGTAVEFYLDDELLYTTSQ